VSAAPPDAAGAVPPWWLRALPWAVGLALLGVVASKLDVGALAGALGRVNAPLYLAFIAAFLAVNLACDAFASTMVYRRVVAPVTFGAFATVRATSYLPQIVNYHVGQAYTAYLLTRVYGAPLARVARATLLVYVTNLGALAAVPVLSLPAVASALPWLTRPIAALAALGLAYLALIAAKPRFLRRPLDVLFEVGPRGHLFLLLCRLPHVATLCVANWLSYYFFHVKIPLFESLTYIPVILLVTNLPITPQGVGTRELVATQLLLPFAPATEDARALIVAAGLAWAASTALLASLLSLAFSRSARRLLRQRPGAPPP
jgi:uncharacterized membrane protein YbhN (UPF0104 family)